MNPKWFRLYLGILCLLLPGHNGKAATYYVNAGNPAPISPFTTWATAATNIQDAINVTAPGDTVLVTNGVYAYGGLAVAGTLTNRVALTNPITVQSVNGPWVTTILGAGTNSGASAVRCAWLTNGASLLGFTLTGGGTQTTGDQTTLEDGGGVWCASSNDLVANCVIVFNSAQQLGAGIFQGTVVNSLINSNASSNANGGAAYKTILENCTVASNSTCGAVSPMAMTNCIIYYNLNQNVSGGGASSHCCTTPALAGTGNFTNAPQLFTDGAHLLTNSPCIGAGVATATGTDIFGLLWSNPPSVGCAEWNPAPVISPQPTIQFPTTGGITIGVNVDGQPPFGIWWTKDGALVPNNGHFGSPNLPALFLSSMSLGDAGAYQVTVSNSFGMTTSAVLQVSVHCVSPTGTEQPPYSSWATAATNIQDAANVAQPGDFILVTNGLYAYGGLVMAGPTNRVALTNAVLLQSVNGPWVTTILGAGATNGTSAVRCAWLTNGAALVGFTLQAGATSFSGNAAVANGGGVSCASTNVFVADCVIASNTAWQYGGGIYQGTLANSLVISNGTIGGSGGAAYGSVLANCTIVSNTTYGARSPVAMTNCIVYYNNPNLGVEVENGGTANVNCCVRTGLAGTGNFTSAPLLLPDGVHLSTNSPCVGAGVNSAIGMDIFGNTWSNPPSVGCAELPSSPVVTTPQIQVSGVPGGFVASAAFTGTPPLSFYWLLNGIPLQDNGYFTGSQTPTLKVAWATAADAGSYQLVVSNSFGVVTSAVTQLTIHLVNVNGANPVAPYSTWATAATNIQDAITAAAVGDIVLVTNGLYATGGISMDGVITNRVSINKAILVQSVNGPNFTIVSGTWDPSGTNGPGAVRCVWLTNNATVSGFTVTGGATRTTGSVSTVAGGVYGASTNALVVDCNIGSNFAYYLGGGAYSVTLVDCTLAGNVAFGSGRPGVGTAGAGSGGGAERCTLVNCVLRSNSAIQSNGGGADNCNLRNCALVGNSSFLSGGAANGGTLVNCTVVGNTSSGYTPGYGAAVYSATLANCIVIGNFSRTSYPNTNYTSCTMTYCCTDPLPSGSGNVDINPQMLADNIHISSTSPCIGAGTAGAVSGSDIDGQPWNNPPSIGCDEWQPAPVISLPTSQIGQPAFGLTCSVIAAGQSPFAFYWTQNGNPIQDNGHFSNSGTPTLTINQFGPDDAGVYQVVVSNAFGMATSQVAQIVIHVVNVAGINPVAPYSTWATAATNIQDAVNAASAGDIVLVANGVYMYGGMVMSYNLTNRVAVNKAITVTSANGCFATAIQGAWDPVATNGPEAVRCVWLGYGATLIGFTLQNGATLGRDGTTDASDSGGGIYCLTTNGVASDCVLSNNSSIWGGGMANGMLNNSLVIGNQANFGGGAYMGSINNCTVLNNVVVFSGGGTYESLVQNSILLQNYDYPFISSQDNYQLGPVAIYYSCTSPTVSGNGNINSNPQFLDWYHISTSSPCRGTGSAAYASGTDLDGESWNTPPSMGCDEVVVSNLVGPLTASIYPGSGTNFLVNHYGGFTGFYTGRAASIGWNFGDGLTASNGGGVIHEWTNAGNYPVTFTVYNNSNPGGVSTNVVVQVLPPLAPQISSPGIVSGAFHFQFAAQTNANYTIQYTTNLAPPVIWQTYQTFYFNQGSVIQINDPSWTNGTRFYQVLAQ